MYLDLGDCCPRRSHWIASNHRHHFLHHYHQKKGGKHHNNDYDDRYVLRDGVRRDGVYRDGDEDNGDVMRVLSFLLVNHCEYFDYYNLY